MLLEAGAGARFCDLCQRFGQWSGGWWCQIDGSGEEAFIARGEADGTDTVIDQVVAVRDGQ